MRFLLVILFLLGAGQAMAEEKAVFAGGCFWCMQHPFDESEGVIDTVVGYTGGHTKNPTYEESSSGTTGHAESIEVTYDPEKVSYKELLNVFWHNIDPLDGRGQFCDKGSQYRSGIFYNSNEQKKLAEESKAEVAKKLGDVATEITALDKFYRGEDYHQDYYKKNPIRYKFYRHSCGRDKRLNELWGDE